jgi:hydroxymethylbilane synthase
VTSNAVRVGTRGSALAVRQTAIVLATLQAVHPSVAFETVTITTGGDRDRTSPIESLGVGTFVREIEEALARHEIDLAVHSLKDLPSATPAEFRLAALTAREDPRDVLVSRGRVKLSDLPRGARVGTSSPRRRAQLLAAAPHVTVLPLRGNVDTRLQRCLIDPDSGYAGGVLAAAGVARLGRLGAVAEFLDPRVFTPAVGQGILAVETRSDDGATARLVAAAEDPRSRAAADAERAFLSAMGGGCAVPVTAHAFFDGPRLTVIGFASDADGREVVRNEVSGPPAQATALGRQLADVLLASGARRLVEAS